VQEARNERKRRQEANAEFDRKISQLAAAQLITEEKQGEVAEGLKELQKTVDKLVATQQAFIESLRRGGNGHS
jgi:hypothetical protein